MITDIIMQLKKRLLFVCFFLFSLIVWGQQDLSLFSLHKVLTNNRLNPAQIGNFRFGIGLPQIASNVYFNGPPYLDFVGKNESTAANNFDIALGKVKERDNFLRAGAEVQTFQFIYNKKNWSINVHHASRSSGLIQFPRDLLELAWKGNTAFIGKTATIGTDFDVFSYEEIGIGGAVNFGKFNFGARIKYLSGHSVLSTTRSNISLYTDDDIYQAALNMDFQLNVADTDNGDLTRFSFGPIGLDFTDTDVLVLQLPRLLFDLNDKTFSPFQKGNHGVAFDLGIQWAINDQFLLTFSALDLGSIQWNRHQQNFIANRTFTYEGLNIGRITFDGTDSIDFSNAQDSLKILEFEKTQKSFSTPLPAQFYLGLSYQLNDKWQFNGLLYHTRFEKKDFSALTIGANYQIHRILNLGARYVLRNEERFLLGVNAALQLGPVQIFAATDNVLGIFRPLEASTLNGRVGLGLTFGD